MKLLIPILLLPLVSLSQGNWEKTDAQVFMELIRGYEESISEGDHYSLETGYRIYGNSTDAMPIESFEGRLVCRSGKILNVFQMGHIMVQDDDVNVTIDTAGKKILVQKPDPSFFYRKSVGDYATLLEMSESVLFRKQGDARIFRLVLKKGNPYEAMDFAVTGTNFISQVTIYSTQPYYSEGDVPSTDRAKIVMDFRNFRKGRSVDLRDFLMVKDILVFNGNNPVLVGTFKDFEIVDLRN